MAELLDHDRIWGWTLPALILWEDLPLGELRGLAKAEGDLRVARGLWTA